MRLMQQFMVGLAFFFPIAGPALDLRLSGHSWERLPDPDALSARIFSELDPQALTLLRELRTDQLSWSRLAHPQIIERFWGIAPDQVDSSLEGCAFSVSTYSSRQDDEANESEETEELRELKNSAYAEAKRFLTLTDPHLATADKPQLTFEDFQVIGRTQNTTLDTTEVLVQFVCFGPEPVYTTFPKSSLDGERRPVVQIVVPGSPMDQRRWSYSVLTMILASAPDSFGLHASAISLVPKPNTTTLFNQATAIGSVWADFDNVKGAARRKLLEDMRRYEQVIHTEALYLPETVFRLAAAQRERKERSPLLFIDEKVAREK